MSESFPARRILGDAMKEKASAGTADHQKAYDDIARILREPSGPTGPRIGGSGEVNLEEPARPDRRALVIAAVVVLGCVALAVVKALWR